MRWTMVLKAPRLIAGSHAPGLELDELRKRGPALMLEAEGGRAASVWIGWDAVTLEVFVLASRPDNGQLCGRGPLRLRKTGRNPQNREPTARRCCILEPAYRNSPLIPVTYKNF